MTIKEMMEMEVNCQKSISNGLGFIRVPGGWIYEVFDDYIEGKEKWDRIFVPEPKQIDEIEEIEISIEEEKAEKDRDLKRLGRKI